MRKLRANTVTAIEAAWHWWGRKPVNRIGLLPFCVGVIDSKTKGITVVASCWTSNAAYREKQIAERKLRKTDNVSAIKVLFYDTKGSLQFTKIG